MRRRLRDPFHVRRQPGFFWQGVCIILPAALLVALGLWSLRQDRLLAEHEATEQARKLATDLIQVALPRTFSLALPAPELVRRFQANPGRAEADPLWPYAASPSNRVAFLVNDQGELLYPPPEQSWPDPQPLDNEDLDDTAANGWEAIQSSLRLGDNPAQVIDALDRFIQQNPPDSYAAAATFQLGLLRERSGNLAEAQKSFDAVLDRYGSVASEAGLPWRVFAEWRLLLMAAQSHNERRRAELAQSLAAYAVLNPLPTSAGVLAKLSNLTPANTQVVAGWRQVWATHERARWFYDLNVQTGIMGPVFNTLPHWISDDADGHWCIMPVSGVGYRWITGMSEPEVDKLVHDAMAAFSLPPYLGLTMDIAGHRIGTTGSVTNPLAVASGEDAPGKGIPGFKATVFLSHPDALYARQRTRTRWFGSMIAAAAISVLVGFWAAWRAFHREQQLSEMKSNFVSSVSHELRAPIASVRLLAEELEDRRAPEPVKDREYHHFIVQECRRLSALIENVLDFSRHEQGRKQYEFEPTDLTALVQDTARLMRNYGADRQIQVATEIRGEVIPVEADGRALQQVLVNLADNAIKHSPQGATITLGLEYPPPSAVPAGTRSRPDQVLLWVEDHGEGIPAEEQGKIFERFYRRGSELRRETPGVGLGLAIVKYVTEAHGGRISIRSAVGQGSRFTVELPCNHSPES